MDSNLPPRESCEACGVPGFNTPYCGLNMCTICVAFVTQMVKKNFTVRCKKDGKCKIAPNSDGSIRCKSCKLKSMIKLNIQHPGWIQHKKSLTVNKIKSASISVTSATPRPTPNTQLSFRDLEPSNLPSEQNKTLQPASLSSNSHVKVKETKGSEAGSPEKLGGSQACRACRRVKEDHAAQLCEDCVHFVIEVKSLSSKFECNQQGDTSQQDHMLSCTACRLNRILNVKSTMPAQDERKGSQPTGSSKQSGTHQTTNQHHQPPEQKHQPVSTQVTTNNKPDGGHQKPVCEVCFNPNFVKKRFNLFLCENCVRFVLNNADSPKRFWKRCVRSGNCKIRHRPGRKLCAPCRTRKLRRLDIDEPVWVKHKRRLGIKSKAPGVTPPPPPQPVATTTRDPSAAVVNAPLGGGQDKSEMKRLNDPTLRKCRACGEIGPRSKTFGGVLLCYKCIQFANYQIETVTEPLICNLGGRCKLRDVPSRGACRACRLKKLVFCFKIQNPRWSIFRKQYISQWNSLPGNRAVTKSPKPPSDGTHQSATIDLERLNDQGSNSEQAQLQQAVQPPQELTQPPQELAQLPQELAQPPQELAQPPQEVLPPASATTANNEPNICSDMGDKREEAPGDIDNPPSECVACGGPSYLPSTNYGLNLCISCVKFVERMPKCEFNSRCRRDGNCRTTYIPDRPIKCHLCRTNAMLKLDIKHPAWIEYKMEGTLRRQGDGGDHETHDADDQSYGVVCGICGNERNVSRKSEDFTCCDNCWTFLRYSEVRNFRDVCKTGQYNCKLEHVASPQKANEERVRMCQGCRVRRAISIGFWDPKLKTSPHKHLLPESLSEDSTDGSSAASEHATAEGEQGYIWCNDCQTPFLGTAAPTGRLNTSAEQDSGVGQSPALQDTSASVDHICPTCTAKRAASLGLRPRGPSSSPLKAREHEPARAARTDESGRVSPRKISPTKDARKTNRVCSICGHTGGVTRLQDLADVFCCDNCKSFLSRTSKKPIFPPDCITGEHNCELRHITASEYFNKLNQKRMCPGCRTRKAISLGYKPTIIDKPSEESSSADEHHQQQQHTNAVREPSTSVSVISSASAVMNGPELTNQAQSSPASKRPCDLCRSGRFCYEGKQRDFKCAKCHCYLKSCENSPLLLVKCRTGAYNCVDHDNTKPRKKICYRCLANDATKLGYKWRKPLDIIEMTNPVAQTGTQQASSECERCDMCPSERKTRQTDFGYRWCGVCRRFLRKTLRQKTQLTCKTGRFDCLQGGKPTKEYFSCPGCRLKRGIDLGYKHPNANAWLQQNNLLKRPEDDERSTSSPIVVDMTTITDQRELPIENFPSPIGRLFVEDDDDEYTHVATVGEQPSSETEDDEMTDVELMDDSQNTRHPAETLDRVLCRWFSNELDILEPYKKCQKTEEEEVDPAPKVRVIVFNNDIGECRNLPLLTQDLNLAERPSVEELTVIKLHMKPSSSLRRTLDPGGTAAAVATQPPGATKAPRYKMTLTLKTLRTTVDRRPMLKKQKTSSGDQLLPNTVPQQPTIKRSSTPPLIAPGENCDSSDEEDDESADVDCHY